VHGLLKFAARHKYHHRLPRKLTVKVKVRWPIWQQVCIFACTNNFTFPLPLLLTPTAIVSEKLFSVEMIILSDDEFSLWRPQGYWSALHIDTLIKRIHFPSRFVSLLPSRRHHHSHCVADILDLQRIYPRRHSARRPTDWLAAGSHTLRCHPARPPARCTPAWCCRQRCSRRWCTLTSCSLFLCLIAWQQVE
jgi:hypothetical protein